MHVYIRILFQICLFFSKISNGVVKHYLLTILSGLCFTPQSTVFKSFRDPRRGEGGGGGGGWYSDIFIHMYSVGSGHFLGSKFYISLFLGGFRKTIAWFALHSTTLSQFLCMRVMVTPYIFYLS